MVCVCVCYCRRNGFLYQYYEALEQNVEGSLDIVSTPVGDDLREEVASGTCQDFFEFRMVNRIY